MSLILQEQVSTQQIMAFEKRGQPTASIAKELLGNPVFFLRKWMSEVKRGSGLLMVTMTKHLQSAGHL